MFKFRIYFQYIFKVRIDVQSPNICPNLHPNSQCMSKFRAIEYHGYCLIDCSGFPIKQKSLLNTPHYNLNSGIRNTLLIKINQ